MSETPSTPEPERPEDEPRIDEVLATEGDGSGPVAIEDGEGNARRPSALDASLANVVAARCRPTVLVLAGGVACGKTSVYAAIYERLGRGPFAGRLFAGSWTIPGFEERCHYWRKSSNMTGLWMKHTQGSDLPWLHLRLRDVELERETQDLLLGDFDGEFFDALINNELQPADLPFLRRADHVGVVVNGAKVADAAARESERTALLYLVDQLVKDTESAPLSLLLVVTKLDLIDEVTDVDERDRIEAAITEIHAHMSKVTGEDVPTVRLAVRSESDRFPLGHGLEDLLEILTVRDASRITTAPPELLAAPPLGEFRA